MAWCICKQPVAWIQRHANLKRILGYAGQPSLSSHFTAPSRYGNPAPCSGRILVHVHVQILGLHCSYRPLSPDWYRFYSMQTCPKANICLFGKDRINSRCFPSRIPMLASGFYYVPPGIRSGLNTQKLMYCYILWDGKMYNTDSVLTMGISPGTLNYMEL